MATLNLFPARVRFVNDDGTLTPEAYRTLQVLSQRVGGPLGDNGRDVFGDITGVAALDLSLTDTVTQPETLEKAHDSVSQSPSPERQALSDVMQAAAIDLLMPDVVQPLNESVPVVFNLAAAINAATSKATPVDADELPIADSASGFTLKKLTWTNVKATLAAWIAGNLIPANFTSITSSTTVKVATTLGVGNVTPSAFGAGISFPAAQSGSTDPNTLDDYEEGDWTPTQGAGIVLVGSFSSSGSYVKVGKTVTAIGILNGSTSIAVNATSIMCGSLPFNQGTAGVGTAVNGNANSGAFLAGVAGGGNMYSASAISASPSISFSITYFV